MEHIKCNKDMAIVRANRVRAQTRMPHACLQVRLLYSLPAAVFFCVRAFGWPSVELCACARADATDGQILHDAMRCDAPSHRDAYE